MSETTTAVAADITEDAYPTRVGTEPELLERSDPVVHGSAADGPLTQEQLRTFDQDGALVVENLFSADEVARMRERLAALSADPQVRSDERTITELASDEVRSIFEIHRTDEAFRAVSHDPRIVEPAQQILGSDVYIHQSRINAKPGFSGDGFWWHSDFETWHAEDGLPRMRVLSASITLTENTPVNGPLLIVPGSHRTFVTTVGETPPDHYQASLKRQEIGTPDHDSLHELIVGRGNGIRQMVGPPGSVVFFDANIMHGSGSNISPYPRSNVFVVFNSVENAPVTPFAANEPRPSFIAAREIEPIRRSS